MTTLLRDSVVGISGSEARCSIGARRSAADAPLLRTADAAMPAETRLRNSLRLGSLIYKLLLNVELYGRTLICPQLNAYLVAGPERPNDLVLGEGNERRVLRRDWQF